MDRKRRKYRDITGMKFGKMTVVGIAGTDRSCHTKWLCRCECGKEKVMTEYNLRLSPLASCGCMSRQLMRNARKAYHIRQDNYVRAVAGTDIKTGRTVFYRNIYEAAEAVNRKSWTISYVCNHRKGFLSSAGFVWTWEESGEWSKVKQDIRDGVFSRKTRCKAYNRKDIKGMKFGMLTVIKEDGRGKNGNLFWVCRCECGNLCRIRSSSLISGISTSCGCRAGKKPKSLVTEFMDTKIIGSMEA